MAQPGDALKPLRGVFLLAALVAAGGAANQLGWHDFAHAGARSRTGFVLSAALLTGLGLPRQVAAFAGGFSFGALDGGLLALLAQGLGCGLSFFWARLLGHGAAQRFLLRRKDGWLMRCEAFLNANPFSATLTLRLLPVGNNLVLNLLAGLSRVPAVAFLAGSLVGYVPQTLVFALAGSGVHVDHRAEMALSGGLFLASAALGIFLWRRLPAAGTSAGG